MSGGLGSPFLHIIYVVPGLAARLCRMRMDVYMPCVLLCLGLCFIMVGEEYGFIGESDIPDAWRSKIRLLGLLFVLGNVIFATPLLVNYFILKWDLLTSFSSLRWKGVVFLCHFLECLFFF